jgi:serine/threonine protein kinase
MTTMRMDGSQPEDVVPVGACIDHFVVDAVLGNGAMGQVYQAHDKLTGKIVALKLLRRHLSADPQFVAGFEHEISLTAAMDHPNIASYAGHGRWQGQSYLAVEHVPGPTVAEVLERDGLIGERQSLLLAIQIAEGLAHAIERCRLVHRDIKPSNLLIDLRGPELGPQSIVKIIDFGLAQARSREDFDEFSGGRTLAGLNHVVGGEVGLGTPYYLSPEQAAGGAQLDFRSDLYSVGATLFHMLTGRVPFPAANAMMAIVAHIQEPVPDPGSLIQTLQPATCHLVQRAMAKDPRQRHLSYDQFIRMARAAVESLAATNRIVRRPHTGGFQRPASDPAAPIVGGDLDADRLTPPGQIPAISGADALREATSRIIRRRVQQNDNQR